MIRDDNTNLNIDMTVGSPTKKLLAFSLPMMLCGLFSILYGTVDSIVLGRMAGADALAAVGATASVTALISMLIAAMRDAVSVIVSQAYGAKDEARLRYAVTQSIIVSAIYGIILSILGCAFARTLLSLLNTPKDIIDNAEIYVKVVCSFAAMQTMSDVSSNILTALGNSVTPLKLFIMGAVVNMVLDVAFVKILKSGVFAVGIATSISRTLTAMCGMIYLYKKHPYLKPRRNERVFDKKTVMSLLRIALPLCGQNVLISLGVLVTSSVVNSFGSVAVAAYTIGVRIQEISMEMLSRFAYSMSVFAGQNYGAGKPKRVYMGAKSAAMLITAAAAIVSAIVLIFGKNIAGLFIDMSNTEIIAAAVEMTRVEACFYILLGLIQMYNCTMRGVGNVGVTIASGMLELTSKVVLSILLSRIFGRIGIWFACPIGWILGVIPPVVALYRGKWNKLSY